MQTATIIALFVMLAADSNHNDTGPIRLAQTTTTDSAHTLFTPNAPDPGRVGRIQPLPQGGAGVTTGGTSAYQTLGTPNGGAIAFPNADGTSTVIGPNGRTGIAPTAR